jgi:hypothetical protein
MSKNDQQLHLYSERFPRHIRDQKAITMSYLILKYFDLDDLNDHPPGEEIPHFLWNPKVPPLTPM